MKSTTKSKVFVIVLMSIAVILGFTGFAATRTIEGEHKKEMQKVIGEKGGTIERVEVVEAKDSPFPTAGKGNNVYKIFYKVNGESKIGWYRAINHSSIKQEPEAWKLD
ncbi:MAG: hypothetical protein ACM32O_07780 [Clostridia bacterium]